MSVDFRKLKSFVKIVDTGSMSRAASILRTAQPALSQQIAALETHFKHKLLIRSNVGITPTEAGLILYRHAQLMLKQIDQAQIDMNLAARSIAGRVSIGLATFSASSTLALPILKVMKEKYPDIVIHINDSFGYIFSELIMTGKMDMALIYAPDPIKGVTLQPMFREELFLLSSPRHEMPHAGEGPVPFATLKDTPLLLPSKNHFLRRVIDDAFARARTTPQLVSEIESVPLIGAAVMDGLGATILPASIQLSSSFSDASIQSLSHPAIDVPVCLAVSDHLPLSEPALAARSVVLKVVEEFMSGQHRGIGSA